MEINTRGERMLRMAQNGKQCNHICTNVAFINGKGGCGKTTSIFHVAGVLSAKGMHVLVIDLDKQRNTTQILLMENNEPANNTVLDFMRGEIEFEEVVRKALFRSRGNAKPKYYNVDVLPADIRLEDETQLQDIHIKIEIERISRNYDWILVDMPPSNKRLNEICFLQIAKYVIVPFSSDLFSISGYGDLMDTIGKAREVNEDLKILGVYLSRYMESCAVDRYIKDELRKFGDIFINVQIPLRADIREAIMFGRPISYFKPAGSISRSAYECLVEFMENKIAEA